MKIFPQLSLLFLFVPVLAAQTSEIKLLHVGPAVSGVKIDVTLSAPVVPSVTMATNPDRLVLELPNMTTDSKQHSIAVNRSGVDRIRIGKNQTSPPVTRVVVDLKEMHPYGLATSGNTITLTVLPAEQTAVAATKPWFGRLLHKK